MTTARRSTDRPAPQGAGQVLRPTGKLRPEHSRAHHRSLVLQSLFHEGPSSRADLARVTGLTRVTISDLISVLIAEGLVAELGIRPEGKVGKPATMLGMRTEEFQVVAVDIADDADLRGAVMTLTGTVVARREAALDGRTGAQAIRVIEDLCRDLLAAADRQVVGIGIGSPGVIDPLGTVVSAPNREWYDLPLSTELADLLKLPVYVANDANTRALGEYTYGGADGAGSMVVTIGQGVGAGIVWDGMLVRGATSAAGEIGHITVVDACDVLLGDAEPQLCACGRKGCLETVLSLPALRRMTANTTTQEESDAVLASAGRKLGIALAPVVSMLNLAEVVLSGPPELLDGPLREAALATVQDRTIHLVGRNLVIRMGSLDEDRALSGAAALVLSGQLGVT